MKVICWYPALTDHQSFTVEQLKKKLDGNLDIYVFSHLHKARLKQGWKSSHADNSKKKVISGFAGIKATLKVFNCEKNVIHIFGSPFENLRIIAALILAILYKHKIYLISEPYSFIEAGYLNDHFGLLNKLKQKLRPYIYSWYLLFLRKHLQGVFAISQLAILQYKKLGVPEEKIFPFGYFVPEVVDDGGHIELCKNLSEDKLNIVFVGNLIQRKGLDLLLDAVDRVNSKDLRLVLTVYGSGDVSKFNFDGVSKIYGGSIPFGNAQSVIHKYDFLVLPSRYDGWGVVVNESIMANVPVLASDMVGAAPMLNKWNCGLTFDSCNEDDLYQKLLNLMDADLCNQLKKNTKKLKKYLTPQFAANYMSQVLLDRHTINKNKPEFPCYDFYYE